MNVAKDVVKYVVNILFVLGLIFMNATVNANAEANNNIIFNELQVEWQKQYGGKGYDFLNGVIQNSDDGFIYVGTKDISNNTSEPDNEYLIMKTDLNGNMKWEKTFGGDGYQQFNSFVCTNDGGFIAGGVTELRDSEYETRLCCSVTRFDSSGEIIWSKNYEDMNGLVKCIKQKNDNCFILTGWTHEETQKDTNICNSFIMKLDEDGDIQDKDILENNDYIYQLNNLELTQDNGFIVIGSIYDKKTMDKDCIVIKYDNKNKVEWRKKFGGDELEIGEGIIQTKSGEFMAIGSSESTFYYERHGYNNGGKALMIASLDAKGNLKWLRLYGGMENDIGKNIVETDRNTFYVTGFCSSNYAEAPSHGKTDICLIEITELGRSIEEMFIGGENYDGASSIYLTKDDGIIVAGGTWSTDVSSETSSNVDMFIVKFIKKSGDWTTTVEDNFIFKNYSQFSPLPNRTQQDNSPRIIDSKFIHWDEAVVKIKDTKEKGTILVRTDYVTKSNGNKNSNSIQITKMDTSNDILWRREVELDGIGVLNSIYENDKKQINIYYSYYKGDTSSLKVLKLDGEGKELFNKTLTKVNKQYTEIVETDNGDHIIVGYSMEEKGSVYEISKINRNGKIVFNKTFPDTEIKKITLLNGDNFVIVGYTQSNKGVFEDNNGNRNAFIAKFNNLGKKIWLDIIADIEVRELCDVKLTADDSIVAVGSMLTDPDEFLIVKYNVDGNREWYKAYGECGMDDVTNVIQTIDKGYLVIGNTYSEDKVDYHGQSDYCIIKLDSCGNIEWEKIIGNSISNQCKTAIQVNQNTFNIIGRYSQFDAHFKEWINITSIKYEGYSNKTPYIEWKRSLGGEGNDIAQRLTPTNDGGYLIVGSSNSKNINPTVNNKSSWVIKITSKGLIEWQLPYFVPNNFTTKDVMQTKEGNYIFIGDKTELSLIPKINSCVFMVDKKGEVLWSKEKNVEETIINQGIKLIEEDDSYTVITLSLPNINSNENDYKVAYTFSKYDLIGQLISEFDYNVEPFETIKDIIKTSDNNYILMGYNYKKEDSEYHYFIKKIDKQGNLIFKKSFTDKFTCSECKIIELKDGKLVFLVTSNIENNNTKQVNIIKYNDTADILLEEYSSLKNIDDLGFIETKDNGLIIFGAKTSSNNEKDIILFKLDKSGNKVWEKTLGGSGNDIPVSIQQTDDNGYILLGHTNSDDGDITDNHGGYDYWIVKLSPEGNIQK